MARLLGAVQFLTLVPVRRPTTEPWRAAVFFPLIGALLGAAAGGLLLLVQPYFPVHLRALMAVTFLVAVTGALHEDGLADVADGCRAGRSPERILEAMKDSRVGSYGALALVLSVGLRWQGVVGVAVNPLPALVAALTLSRAAIVVLARICRPVAVGMGGAFCERVSTPVAVLAALQGMAAALLMGPRAGAALVVCSAVVVVLARAYFHRRIGGVNGDCLGATSQVVEIAALLLLSCQRCMW